MRSLLTLALAAGATAAALAQGVVTGTVLDDLGDPAIGATVVVVDSDPVIGTTTDYDGKYRLEVPDVGGSASLNFSYVGLGDRTVADVVVEDGEVTFLDVVLEESSVELETAVVSAKAIQSSEIALTKIRAGSDKILDGISSQEMSRLSLSDAATAMTKVTGTTIVDGRYIVVRGLGDRYSTAQLNGLEMPSTDPYRNSPQLDLVPSSLLDNIVTSKTFTPDQPGSFTGGNVNLQTRSFPDQRTFSVSVSAGYNTLTTFDDGFLRHDVGADDYFGYDDGTRALPSRLDELRGTRFNIPDFLGNDRFVSVLSPNVRTVSPNAEGAADLYAAVEEAADLLPTNYEVVRQAPPVNHSLGLTYGDRIDLGGDRQLGFILSGKFDRDYAHYADGTTALYALADPNAAALNNEFLYRDTRSVENPTVGLFGTTSLRLAPGQTISLVGVYSHNTQITTRNLTGVAPAYNIDAPDVVENSVLDFLERETITGQLHGEHALTEAGDFRLEWSGALTQSTQNTPNLRFLSVVRDGGPEGTAVFRTNELGRPSNFFRELQDEQGEVKLDLFKDFTGGHKVQVGGAYRQKVRDFSETIFESYFVNRNANATIDDGPAAFFGDDNTGVITGPDGTVNANNFVNETTAPANSYDGTETVAAAYAMGTVAIGSRLRIVAGARLETTDITVESRDSSLTGERRIGDIDEVNFLPSVNLIFSPRDNHNLRASFTQTLARPNMREIAEFPSFEFSGGPRFTGNPQLGLTNVNNFDLRYEVFPSAGGILSASAFFKQFRDPIVQTYVPGTGGDIFFTYVNVERADVYGVELEARHNLGFVSLALQDLTLGANFSLIESESEIDPDEVRRFQLADDTRPLQGQSPYIANASLSYLHRPLGIDAAVSFNVFGDRLAFTGSNGTPDVYERGRASLDVTVAKEFGPVTLRAVAQNLLDPQYETFAEYGDRDFVYSRYQRGKTFKLSVGYTFKQ